MGPDQTKLARKNLDRRLSDVASDAMAMPPHGWVKAIREALGMSAQKLADRLDVSRPRGAMIEKAERTGATSLKTLRETAEAMDCVLVYAIVPRTSLDQIIRDQAAKKADAELERLHHTMRLENQAMATRDLSDERERLIQEILAGSPRRLWDEA
jgi:predicted DNA-binding mobile mystery protein A